MPINSKRKGSVFEREAVKLLTHIFSEPFIRTANSGAFVGGANKARLKTLDESQVRGARGDIQPPESLSRMVIECKALKTLNTFPPFFSKQTTRWVAFDNAVSQLLGDLPDDNMLACLIFKGNGTHTLFATRFRALDDNDTMPLLTNYPVLLYQAKITLTDENSDWLIVPIEALLEDERTIAAWFRREQERYEITFPRTLN